MPTAHCKFPDHQSPSVVPVFAFLAAIAGGAVVIALEHTIVAALVVVAILGCAAGIVFLLIHNHDAGYHAEADASATISRADVENAVLRGRVDQLERQLTTQQRPAIEAPAVHNHLHLHGLSKAEVSELVAERPAIEGGQQW